MGIATVRLNRPDKLNAVTLELLSELRDALVELPEEAVDGLIIAGNGPATCAGMDRRSSPTRSMTRSMRTRSMT